MTEHPSPRHRNSPAAVSDSADQLVWRAFCYVSGELSKDETRQFEAELERSQEARDAVVDAVTLQGAVRCVLACEPPQPAPARRRGFAWRTAWYLPAAATAAAAVLLVVALTFGPARNSPQTLTQSGTPPRTASPSRGESNQHEALATLWVDQFANDSPTTDPLVSEWLPEWLATDAADQPSPRSNPATTASGFAGAGFADAGFADGPEASAPEADYPAAPSWMLSALDGMSVEEDEAGAEM